jgi:hypothetical protein
VTYPTVKLVLPEVMTGRIPATGPRECCREEVLRPYLVFAVLIELTLREFPGFWFRETDEWIPYHEHALEASRIRVALERQREAALAEGLSLLTEQASALRYVDRLRHDERVALLVRMDAS